MLSPERQKSSHITPVLKYLYWLKINERINYKLLSLTYKVLTTNQPKHLHNLISVQPIVTTLVLHISSFLFVHLSGPLWKSLIALFSRPLCCTLPVERTPHWSSLALSDTVSFTFTYHTWQFIIIFTIFTIITCIFSYTRSVFHSELKTWLFGKSFPPLTFSFPTGLIPRTLGPFNVFILLNGWICLHGVLD